MSALSSSSELPSNPTPSASSDHWSILKSTLTSPNQASKTEAFKSHSVHRFKGYDICAPLPITPDHISYLAAKYASLQEYVINASLPLSETILDINVTASTLSLISPHLHPKPPFSNRHSQKLTLVSPPPSLLSSLSIITTLSSTPTSTTVLLSLSSLPSSSKTLSLKIYPPNLYTRSIILSKPTLSDITSNILTGVDNTGQTRLWDCSRVLLHYVTKEIEGKRKVIELGGGQAGLSGFKLGGMVTDGHPESVYNNLVNSKLNGSKSTVKKLMWNEGKVGVAECEEIVEGGKFDLGVCADCVHFVDFHSDLICTVGRVIEKGGLAIFLQPTRGDSMDTFLGYFDRVECFAVEVKTAEEVCEEVWEKHLEALGDESYVEDLHCPRWIFLTKVEEWREKEDGDRIREWGRREKARREEERRERLKAAAKG
ncbi:hypothetical protein TrVE_jg6211 [Triparma verrucosa]|uniref:Calmodulin-lysine N-methyltransferase n=1 Tax=Triparma verrucosa TaxID=1606542 RepID=A0A9W7BFN3_9STRA|nr:hypothetical protein TrVE_jg6211 [Triparma verrucosa]